MVVRSSILAFAIWAVAALLTATQKYELCDNEQGYCKKEAVVEQEISTL
jgi:hypothetical protein